MLRVLKYFICLLCMILFLTSFLYSDKGLVLQIKTNILPRQLFADMHKIDKSHLTTRSAETLMRSETEDGSTALLEMIEDPSYKEEFIKNKHALDALLFFYKRGYSGVLLSEKISAESIIRLHDVLKNAAPGEIEDYINNVTDPGNNNAIALILQSNLLDWDVAMSAYICRSFNIPYIIISNRDGDFVNTSGNELKLSLDREDSSKKLTCPMYSALASTYRELDFARLREDTYRVKTDITKKEILGLLSDLAGSYDTVYFFINTHARNNLAIYSTDRIEYINASDIYESVKEVDRPLNFKIIAGHCYNIIEDELEKKVKNNEYIEYSFLSSSSVKAWEGDLLESLIYADDGMITIDELKEICSGQGHDYTTVSQGGESFYVFKKDGPPYVMDICYAGRGYCDYELRTNSDDLSIFYYRMDYFSD